tara:strand:+ start:487 stop:645 length:159 start_codon:yes stop_codon:yes gene_type:complete
MNFDDYLTEYYGFNTQDNKWQRISNQGKKLLKDSYKIDITKKPEENIQLAQK